MYPCVSPQSVSTQRPSVRMVAQDFAPGAPFAQLLNAAFSCEPSAPPD